MRTLFVFLALAAASSLCGQPPAAFAVASVKRNETTPSGRMTFKTSPNRLTVTNMPLRLLIQRAYDLRAFQISGGPSWIDTDRFDIAAVAGRGVAEMQLTGPMLQSLLEARFGLKLRRETRELKVLDLVAASSGARLTRPGAADCAGSPIPCHEVVLSMSPSGARLLGQQATTAQLVTTLSNILGQPVVDKTGLTQVFDIDLEVRLEGLYGIARFAGLAVPASADTSAPSLFAALPQHLGLRLAPGKGPVEVAVIERVERPTAN